MGKDLDILQAVKDNDLANLQKLLQKASKQAKTKIIGSNKKLNINFQDADGMSALHQAALMSSAQMLRTLLDNGAIPGLRDNKGMVALHYATWQGVPQPVQILLQKGSPVNEQALNGETPLHLACQHGHFDVVSQLLQYHADPTICNKLLKTPLDLACQFGRVRVVELLLKSNLCQKLLEDSPTDTLDNSRTTCLHLAAANGHVDIIQLLLQAGMNINRSTLKGTCLHEAALAGKIEVVRLLLDCGVDVNKPDSYDQTALDIVQKFTAGQACRELKHLLKEASCAVYARAVKDYSNVYDPGSLTFREGDIITVLEQRSDGIWRGYVFHEGRMTKSGMFPANNVVLIDSKVVARQQQQLHQQHQHHLQQQQQLKAGQMYGQVPDLLNRGPSSFSSSSSNSTNQQFYSGSDRGSLESSSTDDSSQASTPHSFPPTPSSNYPPPPSSLLASYPPRSPLNRDPSGADSGFSSSQSLPQYTPSSPAAPQFGKSPFAVGPVVSANGNIPHANGNGCIPEHPHHHQQHHPHLHHHHQQHHQQHHHHHQHQHGDWPPASPSLPTLGGVGAEMRGSSPAKDSPGHSNRNSAASSDSGRGFSTGHTDSKPVHSYVNVHVNNHHQQQQQQHRLSGQSYESGVSSRQSYHSTSSSSVGSLDRLEEPTITSTINVAQLFQAGVPDKEVLQAWLHELHFEEYYPLFYQAGYDMPTISRMTPEDLTAIGITKPAHRKRLKAEIARLNIHDGIPDYKPNDLMEWLHLLGLGAYLDTLCGQGYDTLDYVTDITWEDLEEIGIQKLGHQKKIMLAIDRLKRITSGAKRLSSVDGRTASLELLEPPPPAPPISGRWSGGEISAIPAHVYEGALGGARPKKSPSGDSISTTSSANSGSSAGSGPHSTGAGNTGAAGGEMRVIPLPREDAGLAGAMPFRHNNNNSNLQPDVVAIQVKRNMRPSSSEERREVSGQQLMYQSFQGPSRRSSDNEMFVEPVPRSHEAEGVYSVASAIGGVVDKRRGRSSSKSESEKHEVEINADGKKLGFQTLDPANHNNHNNSMSLRVDTGEHIYDTPQISPSQKSPKPAVMPKPTAPFPPASGMTGPLQVNISNDPALVSQAKPGSPGGKKIPPPPPKRTHSIRGEVMAAPEVAPGSPSKHVAPSTITVSASIHPQPTTIQASKHTPPPVMQKPQKPLSPAVVNKMQAQPPYGQHPLPQQLAQAQPQLSVSQSSSQHQQSAMPAHTHKLPAPTTSQTHSSPAHSASQSAPVFSKPKVSIPGQPAQLQQQPSQPQSPTPAKSPLAHTMTNVPQSQPQQHQPPQLSAGHGHVLVRPGAPAQPLTTAQTAKSPATASPAHQPASLSPAVQQPQVQAFASCVKSLSEKFGKNTEEDDQFPDNVSTDSDDFPPPPPPIAMDIITPKIHNYGIPSRERGKPEFGIHQRPRPNQPGARNFAAGPVGQQKVSRVSGHHMQAAPLMVTANKAGPGTDQSAAVQLRRQPNVSAGSAMSKSDHERTPETDAVSAISNDKRSESTTSFESNSSSSSVDSNTLPFANENVGTIKQRAANAKPSVVQSVEEDDGQKNLDLNADMFDSESHQILSGYSNSASSYSSYSSQPHPQHGPSMASRSSYSSNVHHQPHAQDQHQQPNYHRQTSQPATASASSGAIRPPVPNKKPALSPKPARPKAEPASTQPAEQAPPPTLPSQPSAAAPQPPAVTESKLESGNVLSDIDDMLQGLTDELDAMLEEEMGS